MYCEMFDLSNFLFVTQLSVCGDSILHWNDSTIHSYLHLQLDCLHDNHGLHYSQKLSTTIVIKGFCQKFKQSDIFTTAVHGNNCVVHSLWTWLGYRSFGNGKNRQHLSSGLVCFTFHNHH